eukprot:scaffold3471_cov175-Amphora_coffeaeformis.AAC.7
MIEREGVVWCGVDEHKSKKCSMVEPSTPLLLCFAFLSLALLAEGGQQEKIAEEEDFPNIKVPKYRLFHMYIEVPVQYIVWYHTASQRWPSETTSRRKCDQKMWRTTYGNMVWY